MDIKTLASLVLEKLKNAKVYSELKDENLYSSIYKSLDFIYKKHYYAAQKRIKEDEKKGFVSKVQFDKEYSAVDDVVMEYANKLAAVSIAEI